MHPKLPGHPSKRRKVGGGEGSQNNEQSRTSQQDSMAAPSHAPLPSLAAKDDASSLPAKLWDHAYDELKRDVPKLVDAYEKILSGQLKNGHGSKVSESQRNDIEQDNPDRRRQQMERLIKDGLAKIDGEAKIKERLGFAVNLVLSVKNTISSAIQALPQAALAWGGIAVTLQLRLKPTVKV
ncbi:hypothetical protein VTH82DRAFT_1501 [Thermothelomyces myriococcoides]